MLNAQVLSSFGAEVSKVAAKKDVGQLLASLASRQGHRPSLFPSIQQVKNVATRDRGRAAEIASNIRSTLKNTAAVQAA